MSSENHHHAELGTLGLKPGRALDARIAEEVFSYPVVQQKRMFYEQTEKGSRPLADYSSDISFAWEVARKMNITLLPIEGDSWFAIVGKERGWKSPAEFISFLQEGNFVNSGAAISESAAHAICLAAINSVASVRSIQ